jgi:hypothetical protein
MSPILNPTVLFVVNANCADYRVSPRIDYLVSGTVTLSIGDFRLMGFFKSVTGTRFGTRDTWLYSPVCLLLGLGAWWLAVG